MRLLHNKEKQNKNNDPLIRLMTPMIAGILACTFCLVSMTWAWFSATVNTEAQTIQSATRSTTVIVYELKDKDTDNGTPVKPQATKIISLSDTETTPETEATVEVSGEAVSWDLKPEKSYKIVMTGSGTAKRGYCEVAMTHTKSDEANPITTTYKTVSFEHNSTVEFTYKTGGFESDDGVTATQWKEYVQNTSAPTLTITSYWGQPAKDEDSQIKPLSDGDVVGLAPIPCPEEKAETELELDGFEIKDGEIISAEEDYKLSLTLKEGHEMPPEVEVNIDGKAYIVSTQVVEANTELPYYDAIEGVLTVPSSLLSDGAKVSVKATATKIPVPEPEEEQSEENAEETLEETPVETENSEKAEDTETEENKSSDKPSGGHFVTNSPVIKEEDNDMDIDEPAKTPAGDGGDDDDKDVDKDDESSEKPSVDNPSKEDEKADVKLNLSQLTINLEETQIPTNADLVLTLSAKEDMKLPESIVITLDKTIRDENTEDDEITEDKTEYIINTNGKDNPDGFKFDTESGELTISSELLEGVREIIIADTEENNADEDEDKATLTFEVKNLTFDFTDDEIVTDEDVVITFTAGEGYELPETIMITIDGVEYIIYTSDEDSDKNPEGITFDSETGTLTISKDLLEDIKEITITAEGVEKEDKKENPDADNKNESEDKDTTSKENEPGDGETTGKENETEGGTDSPTTGDKTETEGGADTPSVEDKTESGTESGGDNTAPTEPSEPDTEPDTEPATPTEPSEPVVTPEVSDTSESMSDKNHDAENNDIISVDSSWAEKNNNNGNDITESSASNEITTSDSQSTVPAESVNSASVADKSGTAASNSTSSTPVSSTPTPSTNNNSSGAIKASGAATSSESKKSTTQE